MYTSHKARGVGTGGSIKEEKFFDEHELGSGVREGKRGPARVGRPVRGGRVESCAAVVAATTSISNLVYILLMIIQKVRSVVARWTEMSNC